jgi:hypothetical protein
MNASPKSIQWTAAEPFIQWPDRTMRYEDYLRRPLWETVNHRIFWTVDLISLILLACLWWLIASMTGYWLTIAVISLPASLAVLAIPMLSLAIRRQRALKNCVSCKIRMTRHHVKINNSVCLFNSMTDISIRQSAAHEATLVIAWGPDACPIYHIDIPPHVSLESIRRFLPTSSSPEIGPTP